MVKLESLKKATNSEKLLRKKFYRLLFHICSQEFFKPKHKSNLLISFVMKKIGNAI